MILETNINDLPRYNTNDGLVIRGCGGDPQDWIDAVNELLTEAGILLNGTKFEKAKRFEYEGLICLLFDFEDAELDIGKLAIWRLRTLDLFAGMWLSDFIWNYLEEEEEEEDDE